jgi:hypothetical protein
MLGTKRLSKSDMRAMKSNTLELPSQEGTDEESSEHKIASLRHCVEPGANMLNSFHFHNKQWNVDELPLNSNNIKAKICINHMALYYNNTVNLVISFAMHCISLDLSSL